MRLLQLKDDSGRRRVARVGDDKATLDVLAGYDSILELPRRTACCQLDDLVRCPGKRAYTTTWSVRAMYVFPSTIPIRRT
jgi:hypothetical protein